MKVKYLAIFASVLLLSIFVAVSHNFFQRAFTVLEHLPANWWLLIVLVVAIQLVGHWLRMLRTKTITDYARKGDAVEQFGALSVGYMFNTILPLRAGEVVRALLISMRLRISFLYTFAVIVLERVIDLLLIGVVVIFVSLLLSGHVALVLLVAAAGAIIVSSAVLILFVLLTRENKMLMGVIWRITGWFNTELCNALRFKVWSLIFGLQQFMHRKEAVRRYALLTIASWISYVGAMAILATIVLPGLSRAHTFVAATSPYIAVSAPSGPAYSTTFENVMDPVLGAHSSNSTGRADYVILSWLVITMPMCAIGFVALLLTRFKVEKRARRTTPEGFTNKLLRNEDISQEFPGFLDSYFTGNGLARILHKLETSGELSLVKFFKGGSDAITILVLSKDKMFVKKIIPLEYEDRLKAQYDWLKAHQDLKYLVEVYGEQRTPDYYAIDLAYNSENIPFFEYVHNTSFKQAKDVLDTTWKELYQNLHKRAKPVAYHPQERRAFIDKHIFGCLDKAKEVNLELKAATEHDTITINGQTYDNLYQIMDKIRSHKEAWRDIATYAESGVVHGDIAIDNILVTPQTGKPLIIDPAPDGNLINGPVFDLGKLSQSLYCGYEFLFRNNEPVHLNENGSINYRDHRSAAYTHLWKYLREELAPKYISESEQRALLFHAATLHIRVLKHRVYINPENVLQFYATGVRTLNAFLAQYDKR